MKTEAGESRVTKCCLRPDQSGTTIDHTTPRQDKIQFQTVPGSRAPFGYPGTIERGRGTVVPRDSETTKPSLTVRTTDSAEEQRTIDVLYKPHSSNNSLHIERVSPCRTLSHIYILFHTHSLSRPLRCGSGSVHTFLVVPSRSSQKGKRVFSCWCHFSGSLGPVIAPQGRP